MCKITSIEQQKRNKDRVNVYIDNEYSFACSKELVYTYKLEKGVKFNCELMNNVIQQDNYLKSKNSALKYIERSYKCEKEVRDKLLKLGYDESTINRAIDFLKEYKFIDDITYVKVYVKQKKLIQGKNKIRYSLNKKGFCKELIEEELIEQYDEEFEKKAALKLCRDKLLILSKTNVNSIDIRKKIYNYLHANGFNYDTINYVLDENFKDINLFNKKKEEKYLFSKKSNQNLFTLCEKRYNIIIKSEKDKDKIYRKLSGYLLRRGYNYDEIKSVIREVMDLEKE